MHSRKSKMTRLRTSAMLAGVVSAVLLTTACAATAEPGGEEPAANHEPMTLIVPYGAGGGSDVIARQFAKMLEDVLERQVLVVNKPEGQTVPALMEVDGDPSGNTMVFEGPNIASLRILDVADLGPEDFTVIANVQADSPAIIVGKDSPFTTIEDFIDAAKANPGEIQMAGPVPGGARHAAAEMLRISGLPISVIPIAGGSPNENKEVLGGRVDGVFGSIAEVNEYLRSGDMRLLATGSDERLADFPDVPTFAEAGLSEDSANVKQIRALLVSNEAPEELVSELEAATETVVQSDEFQQFLADNNFGNYYLPSDEAEAFLEDTVELYKKVYGGA